MSDLSDQCVRDIGDDEPNHHRLPAPERLRKEVRPVAKLLGGGRHPLAHRRADVLMLAEHTRSGGLRNTRPAAPRHADWRAALRTSCSAPVSSRWSNKDGSEYSLAGQYTSWATALGHRHRPHALMTRSAAVSLVNRSREGTGTVSMLGLIERKGPRPGEI